ncbi:MAG: hypothetical protein HC853_11230 [Anaerolineae bacterium]|nr:hypothetical protein [Anaerolineae bacterium]
MAYINLTPDCAQRKCSYLPLLFYPVPVLFKRAVYRSESKDVIVQVDGEIQNVIDLPVSSVVLRTKAYKNGVFIKELQHSTLLVSATLPGQSNLFTVDTGISDLFGNSFLTTTTEILTATIDTATPYRNLTVEHIPESLPGLYERFFTVTVRNNHPQTIRGIFIHAWALVQTSDNFCGYLNCYSRVFVPELLSGQVYTASMVWYSSPFSGTTSEMFSMSWRKVSFRPSRPTPQIVKVSASPSAAPR